MISKRPRQFTSLDRKEFIFTRFYSYFVLDGFPRLVNFDVSAMSYGKSNAKYTVPIAESTQIEDTPSASPSR